ncbi:winged helix-turn-helix domain-containing protein [Streptomyces sp. NPDC058287]|uniref:helix-turn-helix domain-containing protein n=1 Tax=unclassified Streptomyces TaxID=2593676 RepID=UPI0036E05D1F
MSGRWNGGAGHGANGARPGSGRRALRDVPSLVRPRSRGWKGSWSVARSSTAGPTSDGRWREVKTLIGRLFHVSYTVEGTWRLLKRHGWSLQQPTRRAIERDDASVELWKKENWPRVRAPRRLATAGSSSRTKPASR